MTRDVSIRLLALLVALALPGWAAAQATAQKTAEPPKAQAPSATKPPAQAPPAQKAAATAPKGTARPAAVAGNAKATASQVTASSNAKGAQPTVPPAAPPARPAAKPAGQVTPPALDAYSYRAEGRRDPFVSLLTRGTDPRTQKKAEGLAGLMAGDIVLKGILQSRGSFLAIVQGPDAKRQLIVRPNDRFADGVVKAITADTVVILQEVNDPLSLTKQREIRKTLRAVEEVK